MMPLCLLWSAAEQAAVLAVYWEEKTLPGVQEGGCISTITQEAGLVLLCRTESANWFSICTQCFIRPTV